GYLVTGVGAGHSTRLPGCACRRRADLPGRRQGGSSRPAHLLGPAHRHRTGPSSRRWQGPAPDSIRTLKKNLSWTVSGILMMQSSNTPGRA
ncbi:MAG: hypothetical protein ACK56I_23575, partial [bacterium]